MTNVPPPLNNGQQNPYVQQNPYGQQIPYGQQNPQAFSSLYQNQPNQLGQMPPYMYQGKPPMGAGKIVLIVLGSIFGLFFLLTLIGVVIGVTMAGDGFLSEDQKIDQVINERMAEDPGLGHAGEVPDPTYISPNGEFGVYFLRKPTIERYDMSSPEWAFDDYVSDTYFTESNYGTYTVVRHEFLEQDKIDPNAAGARELAKEFISEAALNLVMVNKASNTELRFARVDGSIHAQSYIHGPIYDPESGESYYYQILAVVTPKAYYELWYPMFERESSIKLDFFRAFKLYGDHKSPRAAPKIKDQLETGSTQDRYR